MLQILRDHGVEIGAVATDAQFERTIAYTREQLRNHTAKLAVEAEIQGDQLEVMVEVENLAGHKFPTGFPNRRTWLHVRVENKVGEKVFESGAFDDEGRITGLPTEGFEPHHDLITAEDQVQVYEPVMADVNGDPTHTLLRAARYLKDNRLPPRGFLSSAESYADMAIHGAAAADPNFNREEDGEGTGKDRVTYRLDVSSHTGELTVQVELLYQTVRTDFVDDLLGHDTPAVARFAGYYEQADKTPESIQTTVVKVDRPTSIGMEADETVPHSFSLLQNYPNPFNAGTRIPYDVPDEETEIKLSIYDIRGALIRTLVEEWHVPGRYAIHWDGRNEDGRSAGSGVFLYRLTIGDRSLVRKLVVVR